MPMQGHGQIVKRRLARERASSRGAAERRGQVSGGRFVGEDLPRDAST